MGKLLLTIGLIGLCHAAFSATQHRNYIRLTEHEMDESAKRASPISALPLDILLQTLVCLLLSCFGIISTSAKFKPIKVTSEWEHKTWDNISNRTSFYSFNHRGKYMFSSELIKTPLLEMSAAEKEALLNKYKAAASGSKQQQQAQIKQRQSKVNNNDESGSEESASGEGEYSEDSEPEQRQQRN